MSARQNVAGPSNPSTPVRKPSRPPFRINAGTPSSPSSPARPGAEQSSDNSPSRQTLSKGTARLKKQRGGKGVVQYQSLEQLLAQAGYTETRVVTPESIRIKERAAWIRAQEEEERQEAENARLSKEVSEIERILFEDHFSSSVISADQLDSNSDTDTDTTEPIPRSRSRSHGDSHSDDERGELEAGGLAEPWTTSDSTIVKSRHQQHEQQRYHTPKEWDPSSNAIVYHYPADAFSLDNHPEPRRMPTSVTSSRTTQNRQDDVVSGCHNEEECGSLSSSLSTFSGVDTIILSPPDLNIQAFENDSASEDDEDRSHATWSIPMDESDEDLHMSQASSRTIRPSNRSVSQRSTPLPPPASKPIRQIPEGLKSEKDENRDLFLRSEAAQSLRRISSMAQLSSKNSSASASVKQNFFNAFTLFSPSPSSASNEVKSKQSTLSSLSVALDQAQDSLLKRTLRHTASTPALARRTKTTDSPLVDAPPLPTGWLETIRNTIKATVSSSPPNIPSIFASKPRTAFPLPRQSSSPAVLSSPLSSSSLQDGADEKPVSVHLRSAPLVPKVTPSTVVCDSEEGEDLPPFSSLSFLNQSPGSESVSAFHSVDSNESVTEPLPSPVLTPKISFGEGEGWSRASRPGWVWTEGTDEREEDGWYATPTYSSDDSVLDNSSPPRPRAAAIPSSQGTASSTSTVSTASTTVEGSRPGILRAQRSIKSLRETLVADSTAKAKAQAEMKANAVVADQAFKFKTPNRRQKKASSPVSIRYRNDPVPIFCISSPDTLELGLPPRQLDVEEEERRASALVASALLASRREADNEGWGGGRRRTERKEKKSRKGVGKKR